MGLGLDLLLRYYHVAATDDSSLEVPAPVRVNHHVQRSAQSLYIKAVPLPRACATRQLHIKGDDPATPSLELSTRKELFLAISDSRPIGLGLGLELQLITWLIT